MIGFFQILYMVDVHSIEIYRPRISAYLSLFTELSNTNTVVTESKFSLQKVGITFFL